MEDIKRLIQAVERSQAIMEEQQKMIKLLTHEVSYLHKSIGIIGEACDLPPGALFKLYELSLEHEKNQDDITRNKD